MTDKELRSPKYTRRQQKFAVNLVTKDDALGKEEKKPPPNFENQKNKLAKKEIINPSQQRYREKQIMHTFGESGTGVPAFLAKLWRLVDDPDTNNLICWNKDGRSFIIQNQAQFARELLPQNYKHNNMASFIRQLNMYGFHKISSIENGGLKFDRDEMEFSHPYFKRNCAYLLENIKRKISATKSVDEKTTVKQEAVSKVLQDVKAMRGRQDSLDSRFSVMKQENEALWREIASLRQKHAKQQQIVNKLIQFLITIVQPSRNMSGVKRHMQLMIHDTPKNAKIRTTSESESENGGPVIHEMGEELLDEVADSVGHLINPNSPYGKMTPTMNYDNDSTSPLNLERPQSSISITSQNYDYSNQSGEEFFNAQACTNIGGSASTNPGAASGSNNAQVLQNVLMTPSGQQVVYHVSEVPDANPIEIPMSPYHDDNNVLTTPMVREEEARSKLLKEKTKQRRQAEQQQSIFDSNDLVTPSKVRRLNEAEKLHEQLTRAIHASASASASAASSTETQPIQVKIEPGLDPLLLYGFPDSRSLNVEPNLISPNSQMSGDESRHSANLNTSNISDLYDANFISNDMPTDLFEENDLIADGTDANDIFHMNQKHIAQASNRKNSSLLKNGKHINAANGNGGSLSQHHTNNVATTVDTDGASTSKAAAEKALQKHQQQQQNQQQQNQQQQQPQQENMTENMDNMALAKYNVAHHPNELRLSNLGEVTDHIDSVQDELDTLKDLLGSENYSLNQNILMGLFNETDLLDTYGLSFPNDNSNEKKGSELMTYQPSMYDLTDMISINESKEDSNGNSSDRNICTTPTTSGVRQLLQSQSPSLQTPYHE